MNLQEEIYDKLIEKHPLLPGTIGRATRAGLQRKAKRLARYLEYRRGFLEQECICCNAYLNPPKRARQEFTVGVYDTPWNKDPTMKYFCSEECEEAYLYEGDFQYQTCEGCQRIICQQNPSNGWHWQFKEMEGIGDYCLQCYEETVLENRIDREKFAKGQIPGMFFSGDNKEPLETGYGIVEGFYNLFIQSNDSRWAFCKKALQLIDSGHKVVVGYEPLRIGGGEGYVTLFSKNT